MIGISRSLAQQMLFTRFLIHRDALSASFTRMGSGFTPPSVLSEAREHLTIINQLLQQIENISPLPKEEIVAKDYKQLLERNCCGRD